MKLFFYKADIFDNMKNFKKILVPGQRCLASVLSLSLAAVLAAAFAISCATVEPGGISGGRPVERVPKYPVPQYLMGVGIVAPQDLADFLLSVNPELDRDYVENLAVIYVQEAIIEGINHDVAFAQMCLETGFLRFGNLVTADQNNFAGLGATGPGHQGLRFPDPRIGVRAQIQHLKAYATDAPLNQELVNPRYFLVRLGSSPSISGLAGTWAADPQYAVKINVILERLYLFAFD